MTDDEQRTVIYWPTCDRCDSTSIEVFGLGTANVVMLCRRHIAEHNAELLQAAFSRGYAGDVTDLGLIWSPQADAYPVSSVHDDVLLERHLNDT